MGKSEICYYCFRWKQLTPGDYAKGKCGMTKTDTPPLHTCNYWADHPGEMSLGEMMERKRRKEEEERQRREEYMERMARVEAQRNRIITEAAMAEERRLRNLARHVRQVYNAAGTVIHEQDKLLEFTANECGCTVNKVKQVLKVKMYERY